MFLNTLQTLSELLNIKTEDRSSRCLHYKFSRLFPRRSSTTSFVFLFWTTRADLVSRNFLLLTPIKGAARTIYKNVKRDHNIWTVFENNMYILEHAERKLNTNKPENRRKKPCHLVAIWYYHWFSWSYCSILH
jgi:hypothetical protein